MGKCLQKKKVKKPSRRQQDPETFQDQVGPSGMSQFRVVLSSPGEMDGLLVSCSQEKDLNFSSGENKRQFFVSSDTRNKTFFHTYDTTMDQLIVSPEDEWRLSSITEWMPACHSDTQAQCPSSHGPMIASDDQSCGHRQENHSENVQARPRSHVSLNSLPGSHCSRSPPRTPSAADPRKAVGWEVGFTNSPDCSPIQDANLEKRYKLVDECLVRTLQELVERPKCEKDMSLSPKDKCTKQNSKSSGNCQNSYSLNKFNKSPQTSTTDVVPEIGKLAQNGTSIGPSTPAVRRLRSHHIPLSNSNTNGKRLDESPSAQHMEKSQCLSVPLPTDVSVLSSKKPLVENLPGMRSEGSSARRQVQFDQCVSTGISVDDKRKGKNLPRSSQKRRKVRPGQQKHGVSVVVVPSNCRQVLKITSGILLTDNLINNRCLLRLVDNGYPSVKVREEVLDVSNKLEMASSSNAHALHQGGEGDCESGKGQEMPSTSSGSLDVKIENTLLDKGKKGFTGKRKLYRVDKQEYTLSGPSSSTSFQMPTGPSESVKVPPLVMGQSGAFEDQVFTLPESQGFIPMVESQADDTCDGDAISATQRFIPSLNDVMEDDTQTQSLW